MQDNIHNDELYHHGIKGQKWGVRRFQNEDGSLTDAGRRRYADGTDMSRRDAKKQEKLERQLAKNVERQTASDKKLFDARAKNRDKYAAKYDKKIEKATRRGDTGEIGYHTKKKEKFLEEYDRETSAFKRAAEIRNENYNKILELKAKAVSDPSIKGSDAYHKAEKWFRTQVAADSMYGASYNLVMEAKYAYANKGKSWTRGRIDGEDSVKKIPTWARIDGYDKNSKIPTGAKVDGYNRNNKPRYGI